MKIETMNRQELEKAYLELDANYSKVVARNKKLESAYLKIKQIAEDPDLVEPPKPPGTFQVRKLTGF